MTLAKYALLSLFLSGSVLAQQLSHPVMVSRDDAFSRPRPLLVGPDTVRVLAVMVQFQPDNEPRTTGNGQFDLSTPTEPIIEGPPRNRAYFQNHLTFLSNYFAKSSKGRLIIQASLLDPVITLSHVMATYSPPKTGPNTEVGNLALEAWHEVDSLALVPDFSQYDCFVIFHAGVGRDIDITNTVGFDPTPLDIPSLYLGLNALKEFFGPDYQGIPVNGGAFHVTNSLIIPETESRLIPATPTDVLLQLSINGLLCASLGNFLGLPDLFNTNTGQSGIGRFGLMDGQAIFSFSGLFPPEPSAWEKYWLGWVDPITLGAGTNTVALPAAAIADSLYMVQISTSEYFLIENRNRDPQRNGQLVTSVFNNQTRQQRFARDTSGFNAFDLSSIAGVVTNVEDLDWSLPGGVSEEGEFFDGGILIWHIDEAVIAQGLASNGVNANPQHRGVDVEEADGSQDIGQSYGFLDPGSGSEEGTPLDFWFAGNPAPVYRNEFSVTSLPSSDGYGGIKSHITIQDISARNSRMTASIVVGDEVIMPLPGFPKKTGTELVPVMTVADLDGDSNPEILIGSTGMPLSELRRSPASPTAPGSTLFAWKSDGTGFLGPDGTIARADSTTHFFGGVAVRDITGDNKGDIFQLQASDSTLPAAGRLRVFEPNDVNNDSLADPLFSVDFVQRPSLTPAIDDSVVAIGAGGTLCFVTQSGLRIDSVSLGDSLAGVSTFIGQHEFISSWTNGTVALITAEGAQVLKQRNLGHPVVGPASAGNSGRGNEIRIVITTRDGFVFCVDGDLNDVAGYPINTGSAITDPPAFADVDGDGLRDVVAFSGRQMHAFNIAGNSLDYFPVLLRASGTLASAPIVADVDGDGIVEIIGATDDGFVYAYDKNGRLAPGFPLKSGSGRQSVAAFDIVSASLSRTGLGLAVASANDGSVSAWQTGSTGSIAVPGNKPWPQFQRDPLHSGLATEPLTGSPLSAEFFPKDRAYNWPNPVYDGKTFIRYFVREDADVTIMIFDLAGDLVAELDGPGVGGVDNEVQWNVGNVQSGIYLAKIEAKGSGGNGFAIVKVAVVK